LGQCAPVPKTGHAPADSFFATGRCGPAGTSEPSPRAPHGVGSAGQSAGGKFGPVWPSCQNGSRARRPDFCNWETRAGRAPVCPTPHSPRRGECSGARGGPVWASWTQFPNRAPTSLTCFLELGDADRQAPANPPPALPPAWGVLGSPRGGSLGQYAPVPKTGHALVNPFFGTGACGPAGTREPSPRTPHGVGSAGQPAGGKFGSVCPSCQNGFRPHRPVFWNWVMRTGRHPRTLPPRSPRRGECWAARGGARLGQLDPVPKPGLVLADLFWELGDADR